MWSARYGCKHLPGGGLLRRLKKLRATYPRLRAYAGLDAHRPDQLVPLLAEVEVGGEIGRRVDMTVTNNILSLDVDNDFLLYSFLS